MGCWGCCRKDFLLSLLLSSQPPQTPQGTKRLSLAGTQAAGQTVLTSYLLLGNQGPQRKVTRPAGGLTKAGGGGPLFKQRDATEREGGHLNVLGPLLRQDCLAGLGPKSQGCILPTLAKKRDFSFPPPHHPSERVIAHNIQDSRAEVTKEEELAAVPGQGNSLPATWHVHP